jgi:hypothetical protein
VQQKLWAPFAPGIAIPQSSVDVIGFAPPVHV